MSVELTITITAKTDIEYYTFAFNGRRIAMDHTTDTGTFDVDTPVNDYLEWWMVGEPGGSMKVEVSRGEEVIATRDYSDIPGSKAGGFDRLRIKFT